MPKAGYIAGWEYETKYLILVEKFLGKGSRRRPRSR